MSHHIPPIFRGIYVFRKSAAPLKRIPICAVPLDLPAFSEGILGNSLANTTGFMLYPGHTR